MQKDIEREKEIKTARALAIMAYIIAGACFVGAFSVNDVDASVGDSIVYINYTQGVPRLYKKSANDTSNGTAINSQNTGIFTISNDGNWIVYRNDSDGGKLYKKSANDTSNGTAITSIGGTTPNFSNDGNWIVYRNDSDGGKLYKKSANDTSSGSVVTLIPGISPTFSNDGNWIVYTNNSDGSKLYKKSANDTSSGSAITVSQGLSPTFSNDGNWIVYRKETDGGKLYKKSANDTSDGTAITSVGSYGGHYFSTDGNWIVYGNSSVNPSVLYKKSANDTSNGTAITSVRGEYPRYNGLILQTCNDGIQNQDETAIDFGGVCGSAGLQYDSLGCINQTYTDLSTITWYNDLYMDLYPDVVDPPIFSGSVTAIYGEGSNKDLITLYDNSFPLSSIDTQSFHYGSGIESYYAGNIRTSTMRGYSLREFNAVQVLGSGAFAPGGGSFSHKSETNTNKFSIGVQGSSSGNIAYWIDTSSMSDIVDIRYAGPILGLRLGKTTGIISKKSCKNNAYACQWNINLTSCEYPYPYEIDSSSLCGIDASGSCVPIASQGIPLPGQQEILNASGQLISTQWVAPTSAQISNIFSCDKNNDMETTIGEYLTCISTIIERGVEYAQKSSNSAQSIVDGVEITKTGTTRIFTSSGISNENKLFKAFSDRVDQSVDTNGNSGRMVRFAYWFVVVLGILCVLVLFAYRNKVGK